MQDTLSNLWVGKITGRRELWNSSVFLPREFHGQRSLVGYIPWGHTELEMTEHVYMHTHKYTHINMYIYAICVYMYICYMYIYAHLYLTLQKQYFAIFNSVPFIVSSVFLFFCICIHWDKIHFLQVTLGKYCLDYWFDYHP